MLSATTTHRQQLSNPQRKEFLRLYENLREAGDTAAIIATSIGFGSEEGLRIAVSGGGRSSTEKLERLRQYSSDRLPELLAERQKKAADLTRNQFLTPVSAPGEPKKRTGRPVGTLIGTRLTTSQHKRFREDVESLWVLRPAFKDWRTLAYALGFKSANSAKSAYETNTSSVAWAKLKKFTLQTRAHGMAPLEAAKLGVSLEDYLQRGISAAPPTPAPVAAPAPVSAPTPTRELPETPPTLPAVLPELLNALEVEMQRVWRTTRFIEQLAESPIFPKPMRVACENAATGLRMACEALGIDQPVDEASAPTLKVLG